MLIDWPRPRAVTDNGWQPSYRFHQPDLERCLRWALAQYEHVTITSGAWTTSIRDHGDHVETGFQHAGEAPTGFCARAMLWAAMERAH